MTPNLNIFVVKNRLLVNVGEIFTAIGKNSKKQLTLTIVVKFVSQFYKITFKPLVLCLLVKPHFQIKLDFKKWFFSYLN